MHIHIIDKEFYDPFAHYARGVLHLEEDTFSFTAYRAPYKELDNKTWKTEQAFTVDYNRMIAKKYAV
jgi:hypothetical protein